MRPKRDTPVLDVGQPGPGRGSEIEAGHARPKQRDSSGTHRDGTVVQYRDTPGREGTERQAGELSRVLCGRPDGDSGETAGCCHVNQ